MTFKTILAILSRCMFSLTIVLTTLIPSNSESADSGFHVAPPASWIKAIDSIEYSKTAPDSARGGLYYLLSDQQVRVSEHGKTQYQHFAVKVLNEQGLEEAASIEIPFNPAHQVLTLHSINVIRSGTKFTKLNRSNIRIIQREKDLEYYVFDGRKSATVFIDDVRVGDIVEYAYSVDGANPVFKGKHFGYFDLQWSVPVEHIRARVLWPTDRELYITSRNIEEIAEESNAKGYREIVWERNQVQGIRTGGDIPNWFDPYPQVQWSEFKDWGNVARWALPLYTPATKLGSQLKLEIDRIAKAHVEPAERLVETLRFVQKSVRYMGVEVGIGSHQPSDPNIVLSRRFGDCKDKTMLMLTMLKALGIEARAALVNTRKAAGVASEAASPGVFNHVLVRASMPDRDYWVDPTKSTQYGRLDSLSQPSYGLALVIDVNTQGLQTMFQGSSTKRKRQVITTVTIPAVASEMARYEVETTLDGLTAEEMRNELLKQSLTEMERKYLNFYSGFYPGVKLAKPMAISDDRENNRMTIYESYWLNGFWEWSKLKKRYEGQIEAPEILGYLRQPKDVVRSFPLGVAHPIEFESTTVVRLPADWNISAETKRVADPAFEFIREIVPTPRVVTITDTFQTYSDSVAAKDTASYVARLAAARSATRYQLHSTLSSTETRADSRYTIWSKGAIFVFVLPVLVYVWRAYRHSRIRSSVSDTPN